jgi:hypothetical protein
MIERFWRKLKGKILFQKWNQAIRVIIDQIDISNIFSIVTRHCLRAWSPEHYIDWINIIDQFLWSIRCYSSFEKQEMVKKWRRTTIRFEIGFEGKNGSRLHIGNLQGIKCRKRVTIMCLKLYNLLEVSRIIWWLSGGYGWQICKFSANITNFTCVPLVLSIVGAHLKHLELIKYTKKHSEECEKMNEESWCINWSKKSQTDLKHPSTTP